MLLQLRDILAVYQVFEFGVCNFNQIQTFLPCRNVSQIPEQAKSIIVCAFPYYIEQKQPANLCKYAQLPDYHTVVKTILNQIISALQETFGGNYVGFSDISALPEKDCAWLCGLGIRGKNGLIINRRYGSYFMIGEIVTDVQFEPSKPIEEECIGCNRCIQSCPAGAIKEGKIDYERCLSAITQKKGELTLTEKELIEKNQLVWGCDHCQSVCPHNAEVAQTHLTAFTQDIEPYVTYENLSKLMKTRAFGYRGRKLMLRNLDLVNHLSEKQER